ncbi:apolipo protein O-domain-containing protein [Mycena albidolilacea]|uniref:MICOS complex subunit n=1 Tax=Mycena albidolilacea TaxID=1033008 RepID=A0AAD7AMK3_9AGAR|nr:apolipo protein O-domain-containing protein [Mycena albidolilacea]
MSPTGTLSLFRKTTLPLRLLYGRRSTIILHTLDTRFRLPRYPSIYASPPSDILLLDTPSALEVHIGAVRRAVTGKYREAHASVQGVVTQWIGVENRVEHRIKSLLPPDERLIPGTLYAAIAFLAGAILARHRALPIRLLPPALFVPTFAHFLPRTSANVRAYASELEDTHLPSMAEKHEVGKAHAGMAWARVVEGGRSAGEGVRGGVLGALERAPGATGLKLRVALGVMREMEGKVEENKVEVEEKAKERVV